MTTARTVELLEGNDTIRRLMAENLREHGIIVSGSQADGQLCDLLVADVDSGVEVSERVAAYLDDERAVVFCGLRDSRDKYQDERWVNRPFTPAEFFNECADALGFSGLEEDFDPPYSPKASAALKPPASLTEDRDEPITRELGYDEAQELERRLGLDPHTLSPDLEETDEQFEELDMDDSAILSVDHLQFTLGGKLAGGVVARRVDTAEIEAHREEEIVVRGIRSPTFNQTMPDTPHALTDTTEEGVAARDRQPTSNLSPLGPEDSSIDKWIRPPEPELAAQIKGVARMLAESWQRIALTSRTDDRADRIERVLAAAVWQGLRGAADEVQRIPAASGFSGSLSSLTFVEVVRTVRDRRLRGRLEVAIGDDAYVLHMNGLALEDIDTLSSNVDGLLLDILLQGGAIDEEQHKELFARLNDGALTGPIEMELTRNSIVREEQLQSARVVRAREIFRRLCAHRGGQFAFLEIRPGDGQAWPINPLRINVDQLMLEMLRESSIDTGDSQATASTRLQLDANRAAAIEQARLTAEERDVMMFFRDGDTLEAARQRLQSGSTDDVDRIVDRLKKVELLRRSNPTIGVDDHVATAAQSAIHEDAAVISDLTSVHDLPTKEEEVDESSDQTTSLKANWDLIPDTGELDELIEESIANFEDSDGELGDEPS